MNHATDYKTHFPRLVNLVDEGKLKVRIDQADENGKPFVGLESVYDAVDVSFFKTNVVDSKIQYTPVKLCPLKVTKQKCHFFRVTLNRNIILCNQIAFHHGLLEFVKEDCELPLLDQLFVRLMVPNDW